MIRKLLYISVVGVLLAGCVRDVNPGDEPDTRPVDTEGRVLLMYDNIGNWFLDDVKEASAAVGAGALKKQNQRVVVFQRRASGSIIYELVPDKKAMEGFSKKTLKEYARGENDDLSIGTIQNVVADVREYAPALHYGFAFGSHGSGWIPKSNTVSISRRALREGVSEHPYAFLWELRENPKTRFFQSDWGEPLDISEFIEALDEWDWEFIILDDCFMASVEALYEMRVLADYLVASPTEIMGDGFPYDRVVNRLFANWETDLAAALAALSQSFVDWYVEGNSQYGYHSATVTAVKTSELEALAETIKRLNLDPNELTSVDGIQYYEGYTQPGHIFYDLDDYLSRIRESTMPTEYNAFVAQLDRTVVFADHTEAFYSDFPRRGVSRGTVIPVNHFSGLAIFIPWAQTQSLLPAYQQTEWYQRVYE